MTASHEYDLDAHTGFLLAEEDALKRFFSGITVPIKGNKTKEVPVYFRWPESERRLSYPFITLDLLSISPAYDRWHSIHNQYSVPANFEYWDDVNGNIVSREGYYYPSVTYDASTLANSLVQTTEETNLYTENFQPFNLMYQVSTWTRSIQHDRVLTGKMMTELVSPRSFWIGVDADHTWRRCELLEWISGDTLETTEAAKRTFRKIYTMSMEAEIPTSQVYELVKVGRVHVDIYEKGFTDNKLAVNHASDSADHATDTAAYFTEPPL